MRARARARQSPALVLVELLPPDELDVDDDEEPLDDESDDVVVELEESELLELELDAVRDEEPPRLSVL